MFQNIPVNLHILRNLKPLDTSTRIATLLFNNRPFPSPPGPLCQNEGRCSAFDMEIIFHSHANKTHFHKKGCAPSLILKVRVFGTRKWPIINVNSDVFGKTRRKKSLITVGFSETISSLSDQIFKLYCSGNH